MKKWFMALATGVAALSMGVGSPAKAQNILYYVDLAVGTDRMAQALAALPGSYTVTTAVSTANFTTLLTGGGFDMAIFFEQNSSGAGYNTAFAALATFITGGVAAIADDWTLNNTHAAAFGASFPGGVNETSLTVTDANLMPGVSNPVNLSNPGWGSFSTDLTATTGSSSAAFAVSGQAIIAGNGGRTYFNGFLSDTFVDGAEGRALYTNEIVSAIRASTVPEPGTVALGVSMGMGGLVFFLRRRRA